ncbi:MAG: hypothetical protein JNJ98_07505 [Gemmatimonadetes bacterium]|nr:hypothetical protein [Gemmatimonadota bacterium]
MLLSTHIVEDVAVLCPSFAVIRQGKVVALTTPREARASLAGAVYEGDVEGHALDELRRTARVTQAVMVEGRNRVRIHAPDGQVPPGFEPVAGTLEDAYLLLMQGDVRGVAA